MALPRQRIPFSQKNEEWGRDTIDYYEILTGGSVDGNRSSTYNKRINYDLFNGKFNKADLEYVCNPLGLKNQEFPATLQHYDITSPSLNLLIGEETKRPDNCIVISESSNDINRKQKVLKDKIVNTLQQHLLAEIDPSTIDPNSPPPTFAEIVKYEKHNVSDMIESQANKMLKYVKKHLNTKEVFKKGWKDALIAGEEIYWTGVLNNEVSFRRCNPLNIIVVLDGDSDFIDDAQAVTEVRLMTISSIIDEFGDILKPAQVTMLEELTKRSNNGFGSVSNNPVFTIDNMGGVRDLGISGFQSSYGLEGSFNQDLVRVLRVEWKSFKKLYYLTYTDEDDIIQELIVDESFSIKDFKGAFPDAKVEEFWITEAWEGIKIHNDIYINIQPKLNQRRRMDNPYHCKLGYTGLIYNATNSLSISVIDRIKPYQYLNNIIWYRLELAFAQDQGRKVVVDLAQIPRSEGMDIEQWMYYLKAMGIMFINSFEEGRKGAAQGKFSTFNQFQAVDLSMANTIQGYINTLEYIKQQVAFISGVSSQRLGAIDSNELVGNVERSVAQSSLITEYLFDSHDEVKRRVYTALVECAKLAFKDGKKAQFVLDDMGIDMLEIDELEFENSEFNVYMSNTSKDTIVVNTLKQLATEALKADKADLSTIIDTIINDNPRDISSTIKRGEAAKYERDKAASGQQSKIEQEKIKAAKESIERQMEDKQMDRDLRQYEVDQNNSTKITVAEIGTYFKDSGADNDNNGIPDIMEIAQHELDKQELASKNFIEQSKIKHDKEKHDKELSIKDKEINSKKEIENKKIEAINVQNKSQEKMQERELAMKEKEMNNKIKIEKIKLEIAKKKAAEQKKKAAQANKKK